MSSRLAPGVVRDALHKVMADASPDALQLSVIQNRVEQLLGTDVPPSSIRSGLGKRADLYFPVGRGVFKLADDYE